MTSLPTAAPARFVPLAAVAFSDEEQNGQVVNADNPLPVQLSFGPTEAAPLTGSAASSQLSAAFVPELGRPIWLTLSGAWSGTVPVTRSADGGATRQPLTIGGEPWAVFKSNVNEAVAVESEAGAAYSLDIALASGTLTYRVSQ